MCPQGNAAAWGTGCKHRGGHGTAGAGAEPCPGAHLVPLLPDAGVQAGELLLQLLHRLLLLPQPCCLRLPLTLQQRPLHLRLDGHGHITMAALAGSGSCPWDRALAGKGSEQWGSRQGSPSPHLSRRLLQLLLQLLDAALQLVQAAEHAGTLLLQPLCLLGPRARQLLVLQRGQVGTAQHGMARHGAARPSPHLVVGALSAAALLLQVLLV